MRNQQNTPRCLRVAREPEHGLWLAQEDGKLQKYLSQVNAGSQYPVLTKICSHLTNIPACCDSAIGFYATGLWWFGPA